MNEEFHRIRRLPPYVFAEVNAAKARARGRAARHHRPRHGQPGQSDPAAYRGKAGRNGGRPAHPSLLHQPRHPRPAARAGRVLPAAGSTLQLDPETEVIATLGSKEGLANLASAITSPGDTILVPNPSYPIHQFRLHHRRRQRAQHSRPARGRRCCGRSMWACGIRCRNRRPSLSIFHRTPRRIWPTWTFYRELVAFARRQHEIWILSDLAYAEIYFGDDAAALDPAGAGRARGRGRIHLDVEDLFDAGLAHRVCRRQPAAWSPHSRG